MSKQLKIDANSLLSNISINKNKFDYINNILYNSMFDKNFLFFYVFIDELCKNNYDHFEFRN